MKIVVIINPVAGANKHRAQLGKLITRLRSTGIEVETRITEVAGHAQEIAAQAAKSAQKVLAVGGDGTICEIANGLADTDIPLIVWPTGTENLFARSLGFRSNADSAFDCLTRGRVTPFDVGVANRRSFLTIVGVGFDAEAVHRLVRSRKGHITHLSYINPIWRTFWEYRFPSLKVAINGDTYWQGRGLVFIGNMSRYSLGLRVVRDARPDDGLLDLCILPCTNQAQLIGHSLRTLLHRHIEHPGVIYQKLTHIRVESTFNIPVELDGEAAGYLPLDISIRPAAIRVQLPPNAPNVYNR
ncbi:MAG: diacylglycerol kinase family lipid kinase [Planctomycetota bacterium]|nr:MAG: diacylglycerol kinase family lipid kinase [Planctomycetota bacterium]